jgi:hypothetical protein
VSKQKDVGGRPVVKADFHEGEEAAHNFVRDMKFALSVPKSEILALDKQPAKKRKK